MIALTRYLAKNHGSCATASWSPSRIVPFVQPQLSLRSLFIAKADIAEVDVVNFGKSQASLMQSEIYSYFKKHSAPKNIYKRVFAMGSTEGARIFFRLLTDSRKITKILDMYLPNRWDLNLTPIESNDQLFCFENVQVERLDDEDSYSDQYRETDEQYNLTGGKVPIAFDIVAASKFRCLRERDYDFPQKVFGGRFMFMVDKKLFFCGSENIVSLRKAVTLMATEVFKNHGILMNSAVWTPGQETQTRKSRPSLIVGLNSLWGDMSSHNHIWSEEGLSHVFYAETMPSKFRQYTPDDSQVVEGIDPLQCTMGVRTHSPMPLNTPALVEHPDVVVLIHDHGKESATPFLCVSPSEAAFYFLVCGASPSLSLESQYEQALRFGLMIKYHVKRVYVVIGQKAGQVAIKLAAGVAKDAGYIGRSHRRAAVGYIRKKFGESLATFWEDELLLPKLAIPERSFRPIRLIEAGNPENRIERAIENTSKTNEELMREFDEL